MLKALVITPNEKTAEYGSLLAVARAEARKREHASVNPPIRSMVFLPELKAYVAVYEVPDTLRQDAHDAVLEDSSGS